MGVTDTLITIFVLVGLFVLAYTKYTNKTLLDVFREVKDMFSEQTEEVENIGFR